MHTSSYFILTAFCFVVVSTDGFFSKDFVFDSIEFPTELRQSSFNIQAPREIQKPYEQASEALFAVAVRLKSLLDFSTNGGNFLVSPLSVAAALGQLLLGAKGESRSKISEILSTAKKDGAGAAISDLDYHRQFKNLLSVLQSGTYKNGSKQFENYELRIASAFFIQPELRLRTDYRHAVTDLYECDVVPLNFSGNPKAAQETVNDWVSRNTDSRITSLLPYPLPATTASLVANAIYFRGAWEYPFDPELTIAGTFKLNARERVAVNFMRGQFEVLYAESERLGCQMVILPYKHKQASMHIFLPFEKDYDIRNFTSRIAVNDIVELKRASIERSVTLVMPKMTLSGSFSLKQPLSRFESLRNTASRISSPSKTSPKSTLGASRSRRENNESEYPELRRNSRVYNTERNIRMEHDQGLKSARSGRLNTEKDVNDGTFETKERKEYILDRGSAFKANSKSQKTNTNLEDKIRTETITSSIMRPAVPLIVMEVDKTYTVSLNNSNLSSSASDPIPHVERFSLRQGEIDSRPDFQIHSPLFTDYRYPNFPVQHDYNLHPYDQTPMQPSSFSDYRQANTNSARVPQDRISFPSVEDDINRYTPVHSVYPSIQQPVVRPSMAPFYAPSVVPSMNKRTVTSPPVSTTGDRFSGDGNKDNYPANATQGSKEGIQFDLTGASEDSRFRIDDVVHQMWLEVSESGTEAAAATGGAVDYSGDVKLVLVDRPFLFVILHEETRATLFWGAIMDPTGGAGSRTEDPLGRPPSVPGKQPSVIHSRGR